MSRIAGISQISGTEALNTSLTKMLHASRSNTNWQSVSATQNEVALGWCGRQSPNLSSANGVLTVIDGCIYNRNDLGQAASDAQLFSTLYARHGFERAVQQINGDFAIALYNPRIDTLWLARDRFGVKPLYYVAGSKRFGFASRPRALLTLAGVSGEVNRPFVALFAASHYRYFDNQPEKSPYADISQLPAAHMLSVRKGTLTKSVYWSLEETPEFTESETDLAGRYRDLLLDAVSLRLKSTQRPAFTLSGGMDSSSVLASAVRVTGGKQHAFSTVYTDKTYDESIEIRSTLAATAEQWHPLSVGTPDVFGLLRRMVEVHDEPVATATWLSHFLLCEEAASQGFESLFGGLGGDELNAGEYEHFFYHFADLRKDGQEEQLADEVSWWAKYHDHPIYRKNPEVVEDAFRRLVDFSRPGRCLPDRKRLHRYLCALDPGYFDLRSFEPVMHHPFRGYLKNRTYQDLTRETMPCCLRAEDRQTSAFNLDHFDPFLDHRLVEFMFRIPGRLKIQRGVTKILLREAMRGILPEETRTRVKKTGWNAPAHVWFSGSALDAVRDLARSQSFRERGIYNAQEVHRLIEEHEQIVSSERATENHMMFLWQLVNLELWHRGSQTPCYDLSKT